MVPIELLATVKTSFALQYHLDQWEQWNQLGQVVEVDFVGTIAPSWKCGASETTGDSKVQ